MSICKILNTPFRYLKLKGKLKNYLKPAVLLVLLAGITLSFSRANAQSYKTEEYPVLTSDKEAEPIIRRAVDSLYNMNAESANEILRPIRSECPDNPVWALWDAMQIWWTILPDLEDESRDEEFYQSLRDAAEQSEKYLEEKPLHKDALLVKAAAYGFLARQLTNRDKWIKGMNQARKSYGPYQKLKEHYPEAPPVIMGQGLYLYYADYVPEHYPITRSVMWLMPDGDRDKGLEFLWESTREAVIIGPEAKYQLGIILLDFEETPKEAIPVFEDLANNYRKNGYYVRVLIRVLMKSDRVEEGLDEIEQRLAYWKKNKPPFLDVVIEELEAWKGWGYKEHKNWSKAIEALKTAIAVHDEPDREYRNAHLMARYLLGYAYVQSGKADKARQVLAELVDIDQESEFIEKGSELLDRIGE